MNALPPQISYGARDLARAFPARLRPQAMASADSWLRWVRTSYKSEQFAVDVGEERLLIPRRLLIEDYWPAPALDPERRDMGLCLATRSTDGYQRQRALREIVAANRTWTAPFVVALLGEYVIEILDDIEAALGEIDARVMGQFVVENPVYFALTKARVTSYWNEYYRRRDPHYGRRFERLSRGDYVGFRLIEAFEKMAAGL